MARKRNRHPPEFKAKVALLGRWSRARRRKRRIQPRTSLQALRQRPIPIHA